MIYMDATAYYRELKGYKYQLVRDFMYVTKIHGFEADLEFIKMDADGRLTIFKNYAWDGASGPTIDSPSSMRASLVHDALYQLMRLGLMDQSQVLPADKLFREMLLKDGMGRFRAWYWYLGLRLANGKAARPATEPESKMLKARSKSS